MCNDLKLSLGTYMQEPQQLLIFTKWMM